jgi:hypothetical protein
MTTTPAMQLLTDPALWVNVQRLARYRKTRLDLSSGTSDSEQQRWLASSWSRPGHAHKVRIATDSLGVRWSCECESHGPCTHAARVLERIGMLPELPEEEPTEPANVVSLRRQLIIARINGEDADEDALTAQLVTLGCEP